MLSTPAVLDLDYGLNDEHNTDALIKGTGVNCHGNGVFFSLYDCTGR
jgi:hypothetical protein